MSRVRVVSLLLVCTTGLGLLAPSVRLCPRDVRSAEQVLPNKKVGLASYWPPHRFLAAREVRLPVVPTGFFPPVSAFAFWLAYYPLWLAYVWYFKPGPIIQAVGIVGGLLGSILNWRFTRREERRRKDEEPDNRVCRYLNRVYAPPEADAWTGPDAFKEAVEEFVVENPIDQTLVLVYQTGTVKRRLLDHMLRGRMRVLAPAMTKLSLADDISASFELNKVMGLEAIARLVAGVVVPPPNLKDPPELVPVIAIIDVPSKATKDDVTNVLTDVATLKSIAGKNIIPIVCLTDLADGDLKADLRNKLTIEQKKI